MPASKMKRSDKQEIRKKNAEKYKYVMFVETQKVQRKLRQVRSALAEAIKNKSPTEDLEERLVSLTDDLYYIEHYPLARKYISLFPSGELSAEAKTTQNEIRERLKAARANETPSGKAKKQKGEENDAFFASY